MARPDTTSLRRSLILVTALAALLLAVSAVFTTSPAQAASVVAVKPVAVSASSSLTSCPARYAVDGNLLSRWEAATARYPQALQLDLGAIRRLSAMGFRWYSPATRTYSYRVLTSADRVHWTAFVSGVRARYVRVVVTSCSRAGARAALLEVRVFTPVITTISNRTLGRLVLRGQHDIVYDHCTFDGNGGGASNTSGVISIWGGTHDIVFRDCTINPNRDGIGNGVKIAAESGGIHDITFLRCHFMTQPRMGFECIDRSSVAGRSYLRIHLLDCTFEPQGSEAISYDDRGGGSGGCVIRGNVVKGGGATTLYSWGQGMEIGGVHNMKVIGNTFYASRGDIWNLWMDDTRASGWVFTDNVIDARQVFGSVVVRANTNCIYATGVYGGLFARNRIIGAPPRSNVAYLHDCHSMNWRTTVWIDARGSRYCTPQQVECSGNRF